MPFRFPRHEYQGMPPEVERELGGPARWFALRKLEANPGAVVRSSSRAEIEALLLFDPEDTRTYLTIRSNPHPFVPILEAWEEEAIERRMWEIDMLPASVRLDIFRTAGEGIYEATSLSIDRWHHVSWMPTPFVDYDFGVDYRHEMVERTEQMICRGQAQHRNLTKEMMPWIAAQLAVQEA